MNVENLAKISVTTMPAKLNMGQSSEALPLVAHQRFVFCPWHTFCGKSYQGIVFAVDLFLIPINQINQINE